MHATTKPARVAPSAVTLAIDLAKEVFELAVCRCRRAHCRAQATQARAVRRVPAKSCAAAHRDGSLRLGARLGAQACPARARGGSGRPSTTARVLIQTTSAGAKHTPPDFIPP